MEDIAIDEARAASPLVPGAHRVVRILDPTEGPFSGALVAQERGVAVRVDAGTLGGWAGWRFAGAEHVAAPIDVCRRRGGHDALLPWCTDRVRAFLVRRSADGGGITPGETSTLAVSLLRGLEELDAATGGVCTGTWWLTDGGRPIFVLGDGPEARAGVIEIMEDLSEQSSGKVVKRALAVIEEGLRKTLVQPRLPRALTAAWEQSMLDIAAPQPLDREFPLPERARDVARAVAIRSGAEHGEGRPLRADRRRTGGTRRGGPRRRPIREAVHASMGEIFMRVQGVRESYPLRARSRSRGAERSAAPRNRRRRSLLIAGAAAAAVLIGGLLLPEGDAAESRGEPVNGSAREQVTPSSGEASPARTPPLTSAEDGGASRVESVREGDDPVAAASALLRVIADCRTGGDTSCTEAVAGDAERVMDAIGAIPPARSVPELVDEYGDIAVIRLRAARPTQDAGAVDEGASDQTTVVLVRMDDKWLVRDVYDVADQPG